MPTPKPKPIHLDEQSQLQLEALVARHNTPQQIALRARIILLANQGHNNPQIAQQLQRSRDMVRLWRQRWLDLVNLPLSERSVLSRLEDVPRPGAPTKISAEAYCQIMALACQTPDQVGRPITHWTERELADEAIKQQIISRISPRQIGRFLKRSRSYRATGSTSNKTPIRRLKSVMFVIFTSRLPLFMSRENECFPPMK